MIATRAVIASPTLAYFFGSFPRSTSMNIALAARASEAVRAALALALVVSSFVCIVVQKNCPLQTTQLLFCRAASINS